MYVKIKIDNKRRKICTKSNQKKKKKIKKFGEIFSLISGILRERSLESRKYRLIFILVPFNFDK